MRSSAVSMTCLLLISASKLMNREKKTILPFNRNYILNFEMLKFALTRGADDDSVVMTDAQALSL